MQTILVLDSGVGGLSICSAILERSPALQVIYFADDAYFPYGLLDEEILRQRLDLIVATMLAHHRPDLVVLACNTVSTLVLPDLREKYDIPFVGVVPAIKPAALLSKTRHIALLATPATVKREYTDGLVQDFAQGCQVTRIGSSALVVQAERYLAGRPVNMDILSKELAPLVASVTSTEKNEAPIDTVVLGCTHFPLINDALKSVLPGVQWVDSGDAIARRVESLLDTCQEMSTEHEVVHQIYFSKTIPNEDVFTLALKNLGILTYQLHCFSAMMD